MAKLHAFAPRNVLICLMLLLTLISQFGIIPRMEAMQSLDRRDRLPRRPTFRLACNSMRCIFGLRESRAGCCCSAWWFLT